MKNSLLAIHGGAKTRTMPMPARAAFGLNERRMLEEVFEYYDKQNIDPGYEGYFEKKYCELFVQYMGGVGFADAVSTGTASLFIALSALDLPKNSSVLVSPITDPGTISAIILNGLRPKLIDSEVNSYNISLSTVEKRFSSDVSCILVVHSAGKAVNVKEISEFAKANKVKLLEDCSQAHGAEFFGRKVGTFGDVSCFSTMYRKASMTGSSGGVVFTKNEDLFHKIVAHADRGKPRWKSDFDDRNPSRYLFPALNFNTDEISCAIGIASLSRLDHTRRCRIAFLKDLSKRIIDSSKCCIPSGCTDEDSPFYYPVYVNKNLITIDKVEFAVAILEEGISLSPHYYYLVKDWDWVKNYLADDFDTINAREVINSSFNLYLNENYAEQEAIDIAYAISKVEKFYC